MPSWLSPGPVLLRKFVQSSKHDDLVEEVELTHANPSYAHIRYRDGRESSVSLAYLAPCPRESDQATTSEDSKLPEETKPVAETPSINNEQNTELETTNEPLRRSTRLRKSPVMYGFEDE